MTVAYVDSSALTKLVLDEAESPSMRRWYVENERVVMSVVGGIEIRRAVARHLAGDQRVETILRTVEMVEIDASIARSAAALQPPDLRTLDAIHLATALAVAGDIDAFVTYDDRLANAARDLGLPVVRPA